MGQYQRLLLIADPDMRHYAALQRAVALAQASGAALHIAMFVQPLAVFDDNFQELPREGQLEKRRLWLQTETAELTAKGIQVTIEVVWNEHPLEEVLVHVAQLQPDLLLKDVQHESALKRVFITPLDWHLLRECPVPVHLLSAAGHPLPRKVLAAVDSASPETQIPGLNDQIIQAATALALQCDAELHLLNTYDLSPAIFWDGAAGAAAWSADFAGELRNSLHLAFNTLADRYGVPSERRHFVMGPAINTIAEFALKIQADVLVMGTVQRHGLSTLLGSTTEYVLYQAPCNILAVKPPAATDAV